MVPLGEAIGFEARGVAMVGLAVLIEELWV